MHPAGAGERSVCLAANAAFLADAKSDRTEIHPRPQAYRSPKANLTLEGHITNPRIYIVKKSTPKRAFLVDLKRFELSTSRMRTERSPN